MTNQAVFQVRLGYSGEDWVNSVGFSNNTVPTIYEYGSNTSIPIEDTLSGNLPSGGVLTYNYSMSPTIQHIYLYAVAPYFGVSDPNLQQQADLRNLGSVSLSIQSEFDDYVTNNGSSAKTVKFSFNLYYSYVSAGGTAYADFAVGSYVYDSTGANLLSPGMLIAGAKADSVSHTYTVTLNPGATIGFRENITIGSGSQWNWPKTAATPSGSIWLFDGSSTGHLNVDELDSLGNPIAGSPDLSFASGINFSSVACFAAGTRIVTLRGEVPVEALRCGDAAVLATGGTAPITWLGHRRTECARHPRPWDVMPVRIRAHAFGPGRPHGDLLLSPDHAVFADGHLIPVRYLLNGATVVQEPVDRITYWHVELAAHGVLLAQRLPAESYLDTGNRAAFANGGATVTAHPDFARRAWRAHGCARLVLQGKRLERVRRDLLRRAAALGFATTDAPDLRVLANGRVLPVDVEGHGYRVRLPALVDGIRIVSRTCVPAHMRPAGCDCRRLGVAIANIRIDGQAIERDDARLATGWHDPEPSWRWTDGDAGLALVGVRELAFDVVVTGHYWLTVQDAAAQAG